MATSGSVDFSVTRNDIITAAMEMIGEYDPGETMSSADVTTCAKWLNLIVKQYHGNTDFAPGFKTWNRKRGYLFLDKAQAVYTLGPTVSTTTTTDKWATSYRQTTIGVGGEASGQTVISVTSATNIVATDRIGIELDSGYMHWTTVSSVSNNDITIAVALPSAAAAANIVFAYTVTTGQGRRPEKILTAVLRNSSGTDTKIEPMSLEQYEAISAKTTDGTPSKYYYEDTLTDGTIYLDVEPSDVSYVVRLVYLSPIEDFDASTDTPDYPQTLSLFLVTELAKYIAPVFGHEFTPTMEANRAASTNIVKTQVKA